MYSIKAMANLEGYFRSFLKTPYPTSAPINGGGRRMHRGGSNNRFGSPLSGNPNGKYLFGSPTGGQNGKKLSEPNKIGGRRRKRHGRGKLMDNFIYPNTLHHNTFPSIGQMVPY